MMNKIEQFAGNLKAESRMLADRAVEGLRAAGLETAGLIARTKTPVHAFADTGLKFNTLTHKSIEKLLKQQVATLDDLIDGSARRFEMAARAKDVRTLVEAQISTFPKSRDHAVKNAKKTVAIVRESGDALTGLLREAVEEVVEEIQSVRPGRKPAKKAAAVRPRAARAQKPVARTPAPRKAAAKAPAKKAAVRKTPVKKTATTSTEVVQTA
jgi:phasin family protein